MSDDLPTPSILIDAAVVRRNLRRLADYAKSHRLNLRPHTKTHKSTLLARMQMEAGAVGLTIWSVHGSGSSPEARVTPLATPRLGALVVQGSF